MIRNRAVTVPATTYGTGVGRGAGAEGGGAFPHRVFAALPPGPVGILDTPNPC